MGRSIAETGWETAVNKQRLLELAGITEASHVGHTGRLFVVCTMGDDQVSLMGPFGTREQAEEYVQWEINHYDLEEEHYGQVEEIYQPEW